MRDDITSIPISEVFEPRDGCPICRLRNTLEDRVVEYITGAAMMEPDVRIETNKQGFCIDHYRMMLKKRNRLGVALGGERVNWLEGAWLRFPAAPRKKCQKPGQGGRAGHRHLLRLRSAGLGHGADAGHRLPPVGNGKRFPAPV